MSPEAFLPVLPPAGTLRPDVRIARGCLEHVRRARVVPVASRSLDSYLAGTRRSGMRREHEYSPVPRVTSSSSKPSSGARVKRNGHSSGRGDRPSSPRQTRSESDRNVLIEEIRGDEALAETSAAESSQEAHVPNPPRTRIGLLRALVRANVASNETCEVLLRGKFVRVNGVVKEDASMVVDLESDSISVFGRDVEFPSESMDKAEGALAPGRSEDDDSVLTRAQRDFKIGRFGAEGRAPRAKKYNRRIDGGFYAQRRWIGGK